MHKAIANIALIVAVLLASVTPVSAATWTFDNVSRVIAIADIHGAYDVAVDAMQAADVIDENLAWTAGDAHLVIVGDILDRGPSSRAAMDLLMRLEGEAAAAGGMVHVLVGNHEVMNLIGDMRYVSTGEYAAFADEEDIAERERWFMAFAEHRNGGGQSPEALATVFKQKFPRGYFAHRNAFGSEGKYGAWLLTRPAIVVINGTAFVHGGLSPMVGEMGLDAVNQGLIDEFSAYVASLETLYAAEVLLPTDAYHDHAGILERYMPSLTESPEVLAAIDKIKVLDKSELNSLRGPLWYRGNVVCSELIESDKLAVTLESIGAERVVIGHTPTPGRQVLERLDGRVIEIDTGMLSNYYGGVASVVVIDDSGVSVANAATAAGATPQPHPRNVGTRPQGRLTWQQLETLLSTGEISARREDAAGRDIVTISDGTSTIDAVFAKRRSKGVYPEVAAYRLDKLVNLEMVPVAVVREVDGNDGSLQFLPKNWIDESTRQADARGGAAWCELNEQWNAMFVWDALTYNEARTGLNLLYDLDFWQIMLVDHKSAFPTRKGVPARLRQVPYDVGDSWRQAAAKLTEEALAEALGDVLDSKRIRALAARAEALAES